MRVAPFRVCHSLVVKGGIMVWSLDIYLCGGFNLIYCVVVALWFRGASDKGPKGPGDDIFV